MYQPQTLTEVDYRGILAILLVAGTIGIGILYAWMPSILVIFSTFSSMTGTIIGYYFGQKTANNWYAKGRNDPR
jgi:membrane protein YqaA with SNARE-associated domain